MRTLKNYLQLSIIFLAIALVYTSCATVIRGTNTNKSVTVSGFPQKASVYLNDKLVGSSPLSLKIKKRKKYDVRIEAAGYKDYNAKIETKINPIWVGVSLVGNFFPLVELPMLIDLKSGALLDIKTKEINYKMEEFGASSGNSDSTKKEESNFPASNSDSKLAIKVGTVNKKYYLQTNTVLNVTTKSGMHYASSISEINNAYFVLAKNNTKIYYSDVKKMRIFKIRRWIPCLLSFSVTAPIIWLATSKVVELNSSVCRRKLLEIKPIKVPIIGVYYGRTNWDCK